MANWQTLQFEIVDDRDKTVLKSALKPWETILSKEFSGENWFVTDQTLGVYASNNAELFSKEDNDCLFNRVMISVMNELERFRSEGLIECILTYDHRPQVSLDITAESVTAMRTFKTDFIPRVPEPMDEGDFDEITKRISIEPEVIVSAEELDMER